MNEEEFEHQLDELLVEWELANEQGQTVLIQDLCRGREELVAPLQQRIERLQATAWMLKDQASDHEVQPNEDLSPAEFVESLSESGLLDDKQVAVLEAFAEAHESSADIASKLVQDGTLTSYQADQILTRGSGPLSLDRYVILDHMGAGGMGVVYKAFHRSMERIVAIKMLPDFAINSEQKVQRFRREVKSSAKLTHPNVVVAFDADQSDGKFFLVMEFVDGQNLHELVASDGVLDPEDAMSIVDQVAAGLGAAHAQGLVHRDVKPSNIMLTQDGVAKLLDLGLARALLPDEPGPELTQDGWGMGTAAYMSPEQAMDAKQVDVRADIYSLGCTLHFLLTGKPPFERNTTVQTIFAHRESSCPSLNASRDDVPESVEHIYQRMVAKRPEDRFQSCDDLRAALENQNADTSLSSVQHASSLSSPQPSGSRSSMRWLIAVAGLIIALIGGWIFFGPQSSDTLHRDIAKWAITSGGYSTVRNELGEHYLEQTTDIPDGKFEVVGLELYADTDVFRIDPATKVAGLESLTAYSVTEVDCAALVSLEHLSYLAFYDCGVDNEDAKSLPHLHGLKTLVLQDCDITDEAMSSIAQIQGLESLELAGTKVTGVGLRTLSSMPQLQYLDLMELEFGPEDLRQLPTQISALGFAYCDVNDETLKVLPRFKQLESLDLQATNVTSIGIASLASMPSLTTLDLSDLRINASDIHSLKQLPNLSSLTLMGARLNEEKVAAISSLPDLQELDLSGSNLDDKELLQLTALPNLQLLYLEGTKTTEAGIQQFERRRGDVALYVDVDNF